MGKSAFAERLARQGRRVLFVATAEAHDEDMKRRIAALTEIQGSFSYAERPQTRGFRCPESVELE